VGRARGTPAGRRVVVVVMVMRRGQGAPGREGGGGDGGRHRGRGRNVALEGGVQGIVHQVEAGSAPGRGRWALPTRCVAVTVDEWL